MLGLWFSISFDIWSCDFKYSPKKSVMQIKNKCKYSSIQRHSYSFESVRKGSVNICHKNLGPATSKEVWVQTLQLHISTSFQSSNSWRARFRDVGGGLVGDSTSSDITEGELLPEFVCRCLASRCRSWALHWSGVYSFVQPSSFI